jgi:hypothetical protein
MRSGYGGNQSEFRGGERGWEPTGFILQFFAMSTGGCFHRMTLEISLQSNARPA